MRAPAAFATLLIAAVSGAGCAQVSLHRGADRFQGGVGDAASAPLQDLNLQKTEIPEVLIQARGAPYGRASLRRCADISAEVARLDEALGPDLDQPQAGPAADEQAADLALDAVRDTATDLIPFRSWVRRLSGAAQHSREVQESIKAGLVRRAYLKGMGQQRGCRPPAAPAA